jgi:hypothetical protein
MPLDTKDDAPTKFPNPSFLTLASFKRGVITVVNKSNLPKDALQEMNNLFLYEDGKPGIRPGVDWYGENISTLARDTVASITTNYIPNPSFETNTTSWAYHSNSGGGGSISRVTTEFYSGTASLALTCAATTNQDARITISGLTPSTIYTLQAHIKAPSAGMSTYLDNGISSSIYTSTGGWDLMTQTFTANSSSMDMLVGVTGASLGQILYIDAVMLEQANEPTTYFDGSITDTTADDYAWTGVANASTSTRTTYNLVGAEIDGFDYYDADGVVHLVAAAGGKVYRSLDNAETWTECTGATYTAGTDVNMNQNGTYLYLTWGGTIILYDGSTTLLTYSALTTPAAPTAGVTGLAGTNFTYYYKYSAVNQIGFSIASAKVTVQVGQQRDVWDNTTNYVTLTLPAPQATQTRGDIYISEDDLNYYYLASITSSTATPNVTYKDNGTAVVVPSTLAPTDNTTTGPPVEELTNVGSRQFGVRDPNNRNRIWFTGTGNYAGAFSGAYDGGYLDWQPGGKYIPIHVEDYRDGKGTPLATIWCDSADGQGCILQMSLDTLTIQDISITVPSAYKLPGSRGTNAPGSVVNVLNDYMFYNTQAIYNLGSRAQFLNLLSTDEASANIRPTVREISTSSASKIASAYWDAKVFFSVPRGTDENNVTDIFDTERKAWIPNAFTLGFKKFLRYTSLETDGTSVSRLLAVKPGDSRLSEISYDISGDYGEPFITSLYTGLYPITKDRFEFQWTEEAEIELSNPQGTTFVELLGIDRTRGFGSVKTKEFVAESVNAGWDYILWDSTGWDDTTTATATYSTSSDKRYFTVQKELNAIQWHLSTSSLVSRYILLTLQTWGTETEGGHPRPWRI